VLYREGAKGVHTWTKNVNDSGYAADTAKRKLNNLAGDVEYLKGDLEALFIKRGRRRPGRAARHGPGR
jgi:hypothetical protein